MNHSKININIQNIGNYYINFNYNNYSTFDDLLEYVSYNLYNICPCYKFSSYKKEINGNEKLNKYLDYNTKFWLNIPNEECKCNQYVKHLYNKSKITIINEIIKIDKEKNFYKNKLDFFKNDHIIYNYLKLKEEMQNLDNEKRELNEQLGKFYEEEKILKNKINQLEEKKEELNKQIQIKKKNILDFKDKETQLNKEIVYLKK